MLACVSASLQARSNQSELRSASFVHDMPQRTCMQLARMPAICVQAGPAAVLQQGKQNGGNRALQKRLELCLKNYICIDHMYLYIYINNLFSKPENVMQRFVSIVHASHGAD